MKTENIKFKAKRLDNSEWVKGYFYKECDNTYIIEDRQDESMLNRNEAVLVDHKTVCQFTGLKDCKGNEVWEGDIVESEIYDLFKGSSKVKAVIEYMDGEFVAITDGIPYSLYFKYLKVIGNKFDRKEGEKNDEEKNI